MEQSSGPKHPRGNSYNEHTPHTLSSSHSDQRKALPCLSVSLRGRAFLKGSKAPGSLTGQLMSTHTFTQGFLHTLPSSVCKATLTKGPFSMCWGNVCIFTCHAHLAPLDDDGYIMTLWASSGSHSDCFSLIRLVSINNQDRFNETQQ